MYSQLYPKGGKLDRHVDVGLSWGISISFGSSCEFVFGKEKIVIKSGDVFVADFGKISHEVTDTLDDAPAWWKEVETFGRARCNIQLRDKDSYKGPLLSNQTYLEFVRSTMK